MNKFQRELLEKCKQVEVIDEVPLMDDIYVLPTNRKHDSGYKIMYIVGFNREKDEYFLLDIYCDVVNFGYLERKVKDINIDILDNGIIHYWSNYQRFKSLHRVSSCTFDMVDREKMLWEQ